MAGVNSALLSKLGRCVEMLGPVGDVLGSSVDVYKAVEAFKGGDQNAGTLYSGAALAGLGSAAFGVAALCLASGPPGWVALGLGVTAFGLSTAADCFREGDDLQLLRKTDCWTAPAQMYYGISGWLADDLQVLRRAEAMTESEWQALVADYQKLYQRDLRQDLRASSHWSLNSFRMADRLSVR
jgi:hypothetical protein